MNRKVFDPDAEVPLPPHGRAAPITDERGPCRSCGVATLRSALAQHGGRCLSCFEAYLAEPQAKPALLADKRLGAKAWAWALKASEERDRRGLTEAQRAMWRTALASGMSAHNEDQVA